MFRATLKYLRQVLEGRWNSGIICFCKYLQLSIALNAQFSAAQLHLLAPKKSATYCDFVHRLLCCYFRRKTAAKMLGSHSSHAFWCGFSCDLNFTFLLLICVESLLERRFPSHGAGAFIFHSRERSVAR